MGHRIEPGLLPGELVRENNGETLGQWDDHAGIDTPLERLADHAGIDLEQAAAALEWFRAEEREAVLESAAELLGKLFAQLVPQSERLKLETLGLRFIAAKVMLNRAGTTTLTEWAELAGCSKQILSWHIKQLESVTSLHWLGGKRFETRAVYSKATRERWAALTPEERRKRRAGKAAQSAPPAAQI